MLKLPCQRFSSTNRHGSRIRYYLVSLCLFITTQIFSSAASAEWTDISPAGYGTQTFTDVFFLDNNTGFVVGANSLILRTDDGGVNWTPASSTPTSTNQLYAIHFPVNDQVGYVAGENGVVWKTTDGGATWTVDNPPGSQVYYDLHFIDNSTGYVVGTNGTVYRGNNCDPGPCTWTNVTTGGIDGINGVYFPQSSTTGYVVGNTETIRYTSTSGSAWEAQTTPGTNEHINGIHFPVDINTGYIVSNNGKISKTTNGGSGASWSDQVSGVSAHLRDVYFPQDNTTGYVVGLSGTILKTENGGSTWDSQFSGTSSSLQSIHFPVDTNTGYVAGSGGTVLKTTDGGGDNFYLHPVANASVQFQAVGNCSTQYQCINDQTSDAATGTPQANDINNYVQSVAAASVDLYDLSDNEIPAGSIVTGITITAKIGRSNGPAPTMYLLYQREGIDGSPIQGPAITSIGTTCCTTTAEFTVTGLDWSLAELNKLRIGFQHDGTNTVYVSQLYVRVAYTAGNGSLSTISGKVFNDADFNGTATAFQAGDTQLGGVDVELYRVSAGGDVYLASVTTDGSGNYTISNVEDGTYKVRVRSASITNYPTNPSLPELTWANGAPAYGGQNPNVSDAATGDNAGPGDTYSTIVVNSLNVTGVDFGFAYNLIVNTNTSGQGSLGQFINNANDSGVLGANNKTTQFRIATAANRSAGTDSWHGIAFTQGSAGFSQLTAIADGVAIDGSTQTANVGNSNSRGPEIEIYCSDCTGTGSPTYGFDINSGNIAIANLAISGFNAAGIRLAGGQNKVYGSYIGTNGVGTAAASPSNTTGIIFENIAANYSEIGNYIVSGDSVTSGLGNVISGNGTGIVNRSSSHIKIRGNKIGTNAAGNGVVENTTYGVELRIDQGFTLGIIIGGNNADKSNIIAGGSNGIHTTGNLQQVAIQGNYIGTDVSGTSNLGGSGVGISIASTNGAPDITVGGLNANEGNRIANYGNAGINYAVTNSGTNKIQGNTIHDTAGSGIVVSTAGALVEKNIAYDITGGIQDGIFISGTNSIVYHNTVHNVAGDGLQIAGTATGAVVRNNVFSTAGGYDINDGASTPQANITYNNVFNSGLTICLSCDPSNTANTPNFTDSANGDFRLICGSSLLIDAGLDIDSLANGEVQTDLNGTDTNKYYDGAPDQGARESNCSATYSISGTVFNDADFAGTASAYDSGVNDIAVSGVDVELYDNSNIYQTSATTAGDGTFSFTGLVNGAYKIRVRSATVSGGSSVPELAWANGAALYGGQSATLSDTATGDNAGIGDTYVSVAVSDGNVSNVDFGFAYNLIVNAENSGQGSLRQFMLNANAGILSGPALTSQFRMQVAANRSSGGDSWWRISPTSELPVLTSIANNLVLDASTQRTNSAANSNSLGPEIEINGASCASCDAFNLTSATGVTIHEFAINGFTNGIDLGISAASATITGNYIGTDATGTVGIGNSNHGVFVQGTGASIGGNNAVLRNVLSANSQSGIFSSNTSNVASITIQGNYIGTNATGTAGLGNGIRGITLQSANANSTVMIGGTGNGEGNLIGYSTNTSSSGVFIDVDGGTHEISGNTIRYGNGIGLYIFGATNLDVHKNIIHDIGDGDDAAIYVWQGSNINFINNTVYNASVDGINISNGSGFAVRNNIFSNNGNYAIFDTAGAVTTISNNNYFSNANICSGANCGSDSNSITTDPLFVNAASGDFSLTECTSGAINTGVDLGVGQPDMNGATAGNYNGNAPDMGAVESSCGSTFNISGVVFEDANFIGTASEYDGGTSDLALSGVDVELYDNSNVYQSSTTTAGDGSYSFSGLADGTYKVRVRSASINGGTGLPEMTWANGGARYGGQSAVTADTATGDNAGIGDTYTAIVLSGSSASNVNFGFAYNLIVNVNNSGQGSLNQVLSNANAGLLSAAKGNLRTEFRIDPGSIATNQTDGLGNSWWRFAIGTALTTLTTNASNLVIDGGRQEANLLSDQNALGPDIEIDGNGSAFPGISVDTATGVTIQNLAITRFTNGIQLNAGATATNIYGNYLGIRADGTVGLGNTNNGIYTAANSTTIGGNTSTLRNVISGNATAAIYVQSTSITALIIQGNYVGTQANGSGSVPNDQGIRVNQTSSGATNIVIGGVGAGEGNLVVDAVNNSSFGIYAFFGSGNNEISGNTIRGGGGGGIFISSGSGITIQKNIIDSVGNDANDYGIYLATTSGVKVFHNTIYQSSGYGISTFFTVSNAIVQNNIFSNNGGYAIYDADQKVTTVSNNLYYQNNGGAGDCYYDGTNCDMAQTIDANSTIADPLFVNAASSDFSLSECTSPAINAGLDLGANQTDMNGATAGNYNGSAPDMGAVESSCSSNSSIAGVVFEDADYAGTPANWDGGANDKALANVTVELYDSGNSLVDSTTTDGSGAYSFTNVADGTYSVRAVTATIGDADTTPHGGYNACVPATCSYPVPEMTWAYNAAKLGGAVKADSDVGAAAPGDTYASVSVSSVELSDVNLGFTFNAIVNTHDSGQGSFRQFILNANAIGSANGTTASITEFDTSVFTTAVTVQIFPATAYPDITDDGTVIDASDNRIILNGSGVPAGVNGLTINSNSNTIKGIAIEYFTGDGIEIQSGTGNILGGNNTLGAGPYKEHIILLFNGDGIANGGDATDDGIEINSNGNFVYSAYIGTDGAVDAGNTGNGIYIAGDSNTIGAGTAETRNVISGNDQNGIHLVGASFNTVQGTYIGVRADLAAALGNNVRGVHIANGSAFNTIGGDTADEANVISGNVSTGVYITDSGSDNNTISGNYVGTDPSGTNLGNGGTGIFVSASAGFTTIGGATAAQGNIIGFNATYGIGFNTDSVDAHLVGYNYIGTNAASDNLGNTSHGLNCNLVNGAIAFMGNVISNNGGSGVNGACSLSLSGTNDINDDITLSSTTFNMNVGTLTFSGNMANTATTITAGTASTLVLDGTAAQTITMGSGTTHFLNMEVTNASIGGVTFNDEFTTVNFIAATPGSVLTFTSGVTYTFTGTLTLNGQDDLTRIQLNASAASPYTFDIQSETQYAYFVDVDYSHTETNNIIAYESVDPSSTTDAALVAPHWIFENAIVVNTNTDDGNPDSLRQAFINAVSGQNIVFNPNKFPADGPVIISINSSLAANTDNLIITGENAGVIIDGGGVVATCLTIDSSNVTVRGLRIQNCTENGILINSGTNNTIGGNNTSGKGPSGEGNTLVLNGSGSVGNGLRINSNNNFVYGNYIGIAPSSYPGYSAAEDLGNIVNGILIASTASGNVIGDSATGRINVLSANNVNGITIAGNTSTLVANYIGTNENATAAMGNSTTGVLLSGTATGNNIGGAGNNEGNTIAGNLGDGIVHDSTGANNVYGNTISQTAIPNAGDGVDARNGTVVLGVNGASQSNIITGNSGFGVHVNGGAVNFDTSIDINDDVRLTSGSVNMGNATVNLSGNWIHVAGTVSEGTSTLVLDSTTIPQDVGTGTGNNFYNVEVTNSPFLVRFFDGFSCNNFTAVSPGSALQFQANETYTINGTLNINGQAPGTEISLSSSSAIDQFTFNSPNSDQSVSYVNVTRSNADGHDIYAYFSNNVAGNDDGDPSPHWIFNNALSITKRAFLADGTPLINGVSVPRGTIVKYMLYVNNFQASAKTNVSVVDVLDPVFGYQAGTIKVDNTVDNCAMPVCSAAEETAIFAVVDANAAGTDLVDADEVSYASGTATIEAGSRNVANGQLDIAANKVWVILFTVKIQ